MPNFEGNEGITLQPLDTSHYYRFYFEPASSATDKGAIPFSTSVSAASVSASTEAGVDVSSEMIASIPSIDANVVAIRLNYPTTTGPGKYKLVFLLTLDDASVWEKDFNRINCIDL